MAITLVVVRPFGLHAVGDVMIDPILIRDALSGAHVHDVVRVAVAQAVSEQKQEK